jgi:hypothetical protein
LLIIKPLKMVLCSSCDGVPLKFKKKKGKAFSFEDGLFELSINPSKNSLDNTIKPDPCLHKYMKVSLNSIHDGLMIIYNSVLINTKKL